MLAVWEMQTSTLGKSNFKQHMFLVCMHDKCISEEDMYPWAPSQFFLKVPCFSLYDDAILQLSKCSAIFSIELILQHVEKNCSYQQKWEW